MYLPLGHPIIAIGPMEFKMAAASSLVYRSQGSMEQKPNLSSRTHFRHPNSYQLTHLDVSRLLTIVLTIFPAACAIGICFVEYSMMFFIIFVEGSAVANSHRTPFFTETSYFKSSLRRRI